ncbi:HEAT repeat domain-containing protein [Fodinibius sp. Rm-B-1B1-1]|uniref:HEAT repeat domain-containing protein n=1 Tax=Fodinibius alkaliphilus TaxID=3140241 RepID=UPI00315A9736
MLDFDIAIHTLIGLIVTLFVLFTFLLGYTYWTRKKMQYWDQYEQKFRDYFFSLLLDYAESSTPQLSADKIIKKITQRSKDYSFFIQLLKELDNLLDGIERERLNNLIEHPLFVEFYKQKLFEFTTNSKIYACLYFQHIGSQSNHVQAKLVSLSQSYNLKLAFAATKALLSAEGWPNRRKALLRFFRRNDVSDLMISELLHSFDTGKIEDRPQLRKAFEELLQTDLDPHTKSIIVRYMGFQQFHGCSEFLHQYLKRINYSTKNVLLVRALITALGELHHTDSASIIRDYTKQGNDVSIRLAGVKTLSTFGTSENLSFLLDTLLDAPFSIRKTIINEFIMGNELKLRLFTDFIHKTLQTVKNMRAQKQVNGQINAYLDSILEITSGVKIALNNRQQNAHA